MKFLLDTRVMSELVKRIPETQVLQWLQANKAHELCISAMTLAELQRGVVRIPKSKRQLELTEWLLNLEIGFEDRILGGVLPLHIHSNLHAPECSLIHRKGFCNPSLNTYQCPKTVSRRSLT